MTDDPVSRLRERVAKAEFITDARLGFNMIVGYGAADAALAAIGIPLPVLAALADGTWQAVPREPTEITLMRVGERMRIVGSRPSIQDVIEIYAAMLAAAPKTPEEG